MVTVVGPVVVCVSVVVIVVGDIVVKVCETVVVVVLPFG